MYFITLVIKNVLRRRVRSLLTAVGVAIAVGAFVALMGLAREVIESTVEHYSDRGVDLVVLKASRTEQIYATLPQRFAERLRRLPHVESVNPNLFDVVTLDDSSLLAVVIQGWEHDSPLFDGIRVVEGSPLEADDRSAVLLGAMLSENLDKKVDDVITVDGRAFRVAGVFEGGNPIENSSAVVLLPALQELMDRQGQVTGFELILDSPDEDRLASLRQQIEELTDEEGNSLNLSAMPIRDQVGNFMFMKVMRAMAWVTSLVAVILGCVGVLNTMMMAVFERTHEIGVLRAIGWRKSRVMRMIMLEAFVVSLVGAVAGILGAMVLTRTLAAIPTAQVIITGYIPATIVIQGMIVACLVAVLGSVYPAYRAAAQLPTESLRYE